MLRFFIHLKIIDEAKDMSRLFFHRSLVMLSSYLIILSVSLIRLLICYWGSESLGIPGTQIAVRLKMSQQAVSKASRRGKAYCLDNDIALDIL